MAKIIQLFPKSVPRAFFKNQAGIVNKRSIRFFQRELHDVMRALVPRPLPDSPSTEFTVSAVEGKTCYRIVRGGHSYFPGPFSNQRGNAG